MGSLDHPRRHTGDLEAAASDRQLAEQILTACSVGAGEVGGSLALLRLAASRSRCGSSPGLAVLLVEPRLRFAHHFADALLGDLPIAVPTASSSPFPRTAECTWD
jgi:hypothetical protein